MVLRFHGRQTAWSRLFLPVHNNGFPAKNTAQVPGGRHSHAACPRQKEIPMEVEAPAIEQLRQLNSLDELVEKIGERNLLPGWIPRP